MAANLLSTIAAKAGVSERTAYRILNGGGGKGLRADAKVREETVQTIATQMGYRPNRAARATRSGRFDTVGLVLSTKGAASTMPPGFMVGVADSLAVNRRHLAVARFQDHQLIEEKMLPGLMREQMLDGILLYYTQDVPDELVALVEAHHLPTIWVNARRECDCVYPDDAQASMQAVDILIEQGHRAIGYAGWTTSTHYSVTQRRLGYESAMSRHHLPIISDGRPLAVGTVGQPGGDVFAAAAHWLRHRGEQTAVITYSEREATAILIMARQQGLSVPGDLSIIHHGTSVLDALALGISLMVHDGAALGRAAVSLLDKKSARVQQNQLPVVVPAHYRAGVTVGSPVRKDR